MDYKIEELYDEIYAPKIAIEDLIDNACLPNYISVEFTSNLIGLVVESKCIDYYDQEVIYVYQFNKNKLLISLVEKTEKNKRILYSREMEIAEKYREINRYLKEKTKAS